MTKQIQVTDQTAQALSNDCSMLLMVIDRETEIQHMRNSPFDVYDFLPLQIGDKFYVTDMDDCRIIGLPYFKTVDIQIKKVQDLSILEWKELMQNVCITTNGSWINEQYGQGFYESNPYIALVAFKRGE